MKGTQLIKIKLFTIIVCLSIGFALLYLGSKNSNVSSYQLASNITVIDLSKKESNLHSLVIFGTILLTTAIFLTLHLYFSIPPSTPTIDDKITKQEKKIVLLIVQGKSNKEIASELSISTSTVKTHINNIFKKIGISSRSELLQYS